MTQTFSLTPAAADIALLHESLSALEGGRAVFADKHWKVAGSLSVGEFVERDAFGRSGFTLTVTGLDGDFIATGVWSDDSCGNAASEAYVVV